MVWELTGEYHFATEVNYLHKVIYKFKGEKKRGEATNQKKVTSRIDFSEFIP